MRAGERGGRYAPRGVRVIPHPGVPYYSQFISSELVADIIHGVVPATADPRWRESGFDSPQEYSHWAWRGCGAVCLKSAVEGLGGEVWTMREWVEDGLAIGGFIDAAEVAPGKPSGWVHEALAKLARREGFDAGRAAEVGITGLAGLLRRGDLVIASVTHELGDYGEILKNTGHLVLVLGYAEADGEVEAVMLHNPSGRHPELQANAWIPADRFAAGFNGRIIRIGL
jgi:hypothetical protein